MLRQSDRRYLPLTSGHNTYTKPYQVKVRGACDLTSTFSATHHIPYREIDVNIIDFYLYIFYTLYYYTTLEQTYQVFFIRVCYAYIDLSTKKSIYIFFIDNFGIVCYNYIRWLQSLNSRKFVRLYLVYDTL